MKQPREPSEEPEKILFRVEGKMSTFGGPLDFGMQPDEGLALFSKLDLEDPKYAYLFLPAPLPGTSGLGRRLNPDKFILPVAGIIRTRQKNFCEGVWRA